MEKKEREWQLERYLGSNNFFFFFWLHHSSDNTRYLTHWATWELPSYLILIGLNLNIQLVAPILDSVVLDSKEVSERVRFTLGSEA